MKTFESLVKCKYKDQSLCEDGLYINDNIASVIDGATSDSEHLINGKKSGLFAKDTIIEALRSKEDCYLLSPVELIYYLNEYLRSATSRYISIDKEFMPRASVIIFNAFYGEVWSYGDCQCIVDGVFYPSYKKIDTDNSELRAAFIAEALKNGYSVDDLLEKDIGREKIIDRIHNQHQYENIKGGYGFPVLNGLSVCEDMIRILQVTSDKPVILATDGYPFLCDTLYESENRLAELLKEDPLCYRFFKSTKGMMKGMESFDDRTFWKGRSGS